MQEKNMGHICPIGRSGVNNNESRLILYSTNLSIAPKVFDVSGSNTQSPAR